MLKIKFLTTILMSIFFLKSSKYRKDPYSDQTMENKNYCNLFIGKLT